MDKEGFECRLARDIMPLAADGQAGRESTEFLEKHLSACESCREEYGLMSSQLPAGIEKSPVSKRKGLSPESKLALAAVCYAAVVIILLILLYYRMTYMLF